MNPIRILLCSNPATNSALSEHSVVSIWGSMTTFTAANIEYKFRNGFGNNESYFIGDIYKELQDLVAKPGLANYAGCASHVQST